MPAGVRPDDDGVIVGSRSAASRRTERLMCLVFILRARGRRGITKAELRRAIDDYAACPTAEAFERMLERDKRDLRDAGVLVDVVQRDAWHEDEHAYVLHADTLLTLPVLGADELRMLALAAEAWQRGAWDALAHGALHKLEVFAPELTAVERPRISWTVDTHLEALRAAIRARRAVRFAYRRPGDAEAGERHVEPWGLLARGGAWYCVGFDLDRGAPRVFRLNRLDGTVVTAEPASHDVDPAWAAIPSASEFAGVRALLRVAPDRGWTWRDAGNVVGSEQVDGQVHDHIAVDIPDHAIGALAAAAPAVVVLEPADLRARVIAHLEGVARG